MDVGGYAVAGVFQVVSRGFGVVSIIDQVFWVAVRSCCEIDGVFWVVVRGF